MSKTNPLEHNGMHSLCSLHNTRTIPDTPHQMKESKHRVVVEQLVKILAHRAMAGGHTYLKMSDHARACTTMMKQTGWPRNPSIPRCPLTPISHMGKQLMRAWQCPRIKRKSHQKGQHLYHTIPCAGGSRQPTEQLPYKQSTTQTHHRLRKQRWSLCQAMGKRKPQATQTQ